MADRERLKSDGWALAGLGLWALGYFGGWKQPDAPALAPMWRIFTVLGPLGFVLGVRSSTSRWRLLGWCALAGALAESRLFTAGFNIMPLVTPDLVRWKAMAIWAVVPILDGFPWLLFAMLLRLVCEARPRAMPLAAALGIVLFEVFVPRTFGWSWCISFTGWPPLAQAAALVGSPGMSAILWFFGAQGAMAISPSEHTASFNLGTLGAFSLSAVALLLALSFGARLLPRGPLLDRDFLFVQPMFQKADSERDISQAVLWRQVDRVLNRESLPGVGRPLLVLLPEGTLRGPSRYTAPEDVAEEGRRRNVAVAVGVVGDKQEYNQVPPVPFHACTPVRSAVYLVGEGVASQTYVRAHLFPWMEWIPLPSKRLRQWVQDGLQTLPHEQGDPTTAFEWEGVRMAPTLCGEGLEFSRMWRLAEARLDLVLNPTNDYLFGDQASGAYQASVASLRAVELGVPFLLVNNTGPSGVAHADGSLELWGERRQVAIWPYRMKWEAIHTPFRHASYGPFLVGLLGFVFLMRLVWPGQGQKLPNMQA